MTRFLLIGSLLIIFMATNLQTADGQSTLQTINLKKGEVLDILLLSQNSGTEEDFKAYFQTAVLVAKRMSYQSLPGFRTTAHVQGNFCPNALILSKWDNLDIREQFLEEIIKEVPTFHEQRRTIWSYFGLRYFEIQEDIDFTVDQAKFQVATAYWLDAEKESSQYYKRWKGSIQKMGGKVLIELKEGRSPFGYQFNPDYFVITSWENEASFKKIQEKAQQSNMDNIQQINAPELSRLLNERIGMSFFEFVNYYRIHEFISLAKSLGIEQKTLLGLAQEAGFHSKSTFHKSFKQIMGCPPSEYLKKVEYS